MENSFNIKSFRVFDEKGATFDFKPISFLTGTNSSGKSSLTKAVLLMHDFVSSGLNSKFDPALYELDFSRPYLKLGGFKTEKNRCSEANEITFSYSVSPICALDLTFNVEYSFVEKGSGTSNSLYDNGMLSRIVVRFHEDTILEVRVEEREYKIDTICISHLGFFRSFEWFYIIVNVLNKRKQRHDISDIYGIPVDENKKNELEGAISNLINYAISRGFDLSADSLAEIDTTAMRATLDELLQSNSCLVYSDLKEAFDKFHETKSLFFFSVFEEQEDLINSCSKGKTIMAPSHELVASFASLEKKYRSNAMDFYSDLQHPLSFFTHNGIVDSILDKLTVKSKVAEQVSERAIKEQEKAKTQIEEEFQSSLNNELSRSSIEPDEVSEEIVKSLKIIDQMMGSLNPSAFGEEYNQLSQIQYNYLKMRGANEDDYVRIVEEIDNESPFSPVSKFLKHKLYSAFCDYYRILIQQILCPRFLVNIEYWGDSHENIKRVHSLPDKMDIMVSRLMDYLRAKESFAKINRRREKEVNDTTFMNHWLSVLGIGEALEIEVDSNTMAASLMLRKRDGARVNLADEGYGIYQLVILLLSIETEILEQQLVINDMTIGHVLPQLSSSNQPRVSLVPTTIVLEEPEANLHPAFQSRLAEILYSAYKETNGSVHFIIETHSEYLIRATQAIVAKTVENEEDLKTIPFVVYYMGKGGEAYDMEYQVSGRFKRPFGTGFFDEAGKSAIEILKKERRMKDGSNA